MKTKEVRSCTVFENDEVLLRGSETEVRQAVRRARAVRPLGKLIAFFDDNGEDFEVEYVPPGTADAIPEPLVEENLVRKAGRPRLGVVAREVTLLPRHWEWLETQPSGPSAALRRLVESARRDSAPADRTRRSVEATYRFLYTMVGNTAFFPELCRALFRRDWERFDAQLGSWVAWELGEYARMLSRPARVEPVAG